MSQPGTKNPESPTLIVTGASRGLGEATARISARMGANVVLSARSAGRLEVVAGEIRAAGGRALAIPGDVSGREDNQRLVEAAIREFGRIDALVNNAGVLEPVAPFALSEPESWEYNLAVNLLGLVNLTRLALPHLRNVGGRVVHVSTGASVNPVPGWSAYCAAKAALNHFSSVLALEEPGITSITFRPGAVDTEMQAVIRRQGAEGMTAKKHNYFVRLHESNELLPPETPGRALALLALRAPRQWSGEFIQWNEERIQLLENQ